MSMPYNSTRWTQPINRAPESRRIKTGAHDLLSALFSKVSALQLGRKHRPDYTMVILILALALTGLVVLFSIAPAITSGSDGGQAAFMWRQGLFLGIGLLAFGIASKIPLDFWRRWSGRLFVIALVLCFLVPVLGAIHVPIVTCSLGACRWYNLGVGSFQPAEFLKLGVVLFVSGFLAVKVQKGEINHWRKTLLPLGIVMLAALFVIVIMQKDMGTGVALMAIVLVQLIVAGLNVRNMMMILAVVGALGVVSIIVAPHRLARVATFFGGGTAETDYHINQAMIALGSGGWTGRGLGQSVQAFGWLPEAVNDSIFAILGETLGFVGLLVIIGMFALLLKRIIDKVDYTENVYLRLIVAGVFGWLGAHVALNIGAMTHIIPLTGITLPLVSFGGTSMLFIMLALGVVFAISRYTLHSKVKSGEGGVNENSVGGRRQWRSHYADRGDR